MAYIGQNALPFDPFRSAAPTSDADRFSGNASTTTFTLTRTVSFPTDIEVFVENVQQEPIVAYGVSGATLTFTEAPPTGTNNVYVVYRNYQTGAQITLPDGSVSYSKLANNIRLFTTDNFTANGAGQTYVLTEQPADANTVFVTIDGIVQRAPEHYSLSGSTIIFTSTVATNSLISVRHLGFRTTTTVTAIPPGTSLSNPVVTNGMSVTGDVTVTNDVNVTGDVTVTNDVIVSQDASVSGNLSFNSGYGSSAVAYGCRAWVNFNGTGTVAIRASGNVSSITDNGTGDYTVNFTTAMPDINYSPNVSISSDVGFAPQVTAVNNKAAGGFANVIPTTSAFRFTTGRATDGNSIDALHALVSVFR